MPFRNYLWPKYSIQNKMHASHIIVWMKRQQSTCSINHGYIDSSTSAAIAATATDTKNVQNECAFMLRIGNRFQLRYVVVFGTFFDEKFIRRKRVAVGKAVCGKFRATIKVNLTILLTRKLCFNWNLVISEPLLCSVFRVDASLVWNWKDSVKWFEAQAIKWKQFTRAFIEAQFIWSLSSETIMEWKKIRNGFLGRIHKK